MTKTWARVAARIYAILIVPIASGFVAGAVFVLSLSPAAVKQITNAAGALSTFVPLFTVLAAAIGWFVAAALNGEEARRTERDRREHAREGARRQVRTLLRVAIATISTHSCVLESFNFSDLELVQQRFIERLNDRETAVALSDTEYDALDTFVSAIAFTFTWIEQIERLSNGKLLDNHNQKSALEYSLYSLLHSLKTAVTLLGDTKMLADVANDQQRMSKNVEIYKKTLLSRSGMGR